MQKYIIAGCMGVLAVVAGVLAQKAYVSDQTNSTQVGIGSNPIIATTTSATSSSTATTASSSQTAPVASTPISIPVATVPIVPIQQPTTTMSNPRINSDNDKDDTATGNEKSFTAYITGYSYWDNTPPGSSIISNGVIHDVAGGTGTYDDPITIAVGHSISGNTDTLDYPEGTRFYFPHIKKYGIVEDTCGDGNRPQDGPCHTGYEGNPWLDIYVGGEDVSRSASDDCMNDITDVHTVIQNPNKKYEVVKGALSESGCKVF